MDNFERFVENIVRRYNTFGGGGEISRAMGIVSEDYILNKISRLNQGYKPVKSAGSRTPADIYSITKRNGYLHLMLTQVKSTQENHKDPYPKSEIENDKEKYIKLVGLIKEEYPKFSKEPLIITMGWAKVNTKVWEDKNKKEYFSEENTKFKFDKKKHYYRNKFIEGNYHSNNDDITKITIGSSLNLEKEKMFFSQVYSLQ